MKLIIRLCLLALLSLTIYLIPRDFLSANFFKVKTIKIETKSKILLRELTEMLKIAYNKNIWDIDLKKIESQLQKDVRFQSVKVYSDSLGSLNIDVIEKVPEYFVQLKGNIYVADKKGEIFGFLSENEERDLYFLNIKSKEEIQPLVEIAKFIDEMLLKNLVSQLYVEDKNCINIILVDGTIIKTNITVGREKYRILETLYSELIKTKKIKYIDIRFNDFVVKMVGGGKGE